MIDTDRLILRSWQAADAPAYHAIISDPRVIATLGDRPRGRKPLEVIERQNALLAEHGYCFWALEERSTASFVGWCGIKPGKWPIDDSTEIGWTLAPTAWGKGLAFEAAGATLAWAWANTRLASVAAITTPGNVRSRQLMERLGMVRMLGEDFDHPDLPEGDPLRRHVLYRIVRPNER